MNQRLIDLAIEQIQQDVANQDFTAIEGLLTRVSEQDLKGFLSETIGCDEDTEDLDGQPTEQEEWHSFDPDC